MLQSAKGESPEHDDSDESDKESDGTADQLHKARLLKGHDVLKCVELCSAELLLSCC